MSTPPSVPDPGRPDAGPAAWAASGAMALTGSPDGPALGPPSRLVPGLQGIADGLADRTAGVGRRLELDPLALLGERAALTGLTRGGRTSCGGASRLLRTADGWVAVSLARPDDWDLVPAWLGVEPRWDDVTAAVAERPGDHVVEQGVLLGLPIAVLPATDPGPADAGLPVLACRVGETTAGVELAGALVVDLTSLWAGPLCGSLLADAGATVVKVESLGRPDGARSGPRAFFDLLNAGKRSLAVDLTGVAGRAQLAALVGAADIVLEGSRPRALEQLGVHRTAVMTAPGPQVWVSITGHGRHAEARDRVAFGDDAAVAGGLVAHDADGPCFCADAVADPATGLTAAAAVVDALVSGGRWTIDVALSSVAAHLAGPTLPVPPGLAPAPPRSRPLRGTGPALGADTDAVLAELAAHA